MEEAELEKQRRMVTKSSSSIKRKPLSDLTNIARKPLQVSSSKKPLSSSASNSSIGSTQNPIHVHRSIIVPPDRPLLSKPQRLASDRPVGNENHIAYTQRQNTQITRSKTKAAAPFYQTQETGNNGKEGSVSLSSSTSEKVKDQGYVNHSCLDKTKNDEKKVSVAPHFSSLEKTKDKRKATDVPLSAYNLKNAKNCMNTPIPHYATQIKDKRKENVGQSSYPFAGNASFNMDVTMPDSLMKRKDKGKAIAVDYPTTKNVKSNIVGVRVLLKGVIIKDREETVTGSCNNDLVQKDNVKENDGQSSNPFAGNANINMEITMPDSLMKRKDKGKAIAMDYPTMKNVKSNMVGVRLPLKGVIIKDTEETIRGSSHIDLVQKDKGKAVVTPISYSALEKKDKQRSCPPLLRTMSTRNEADGAEDMIQSKLQTEPPRNKKKRRTSSKEVVEEYALPQDYVEQQRAYFKEIDDFELQVEEV